MKRGRKTDASEPLHKILPSRPKAPSYLNEWSQKRWNDIVDSRPVEYFQDSDLQLLEQLIFSEFFAQECNENITTFGPVIGDLEGRPIKNPNVTIRRDCLAEMARIQFLLRLCPSARYRPNSAKLKPGEQGPKVNLWDK